MYYGIVIAVWFATFAMMVQSGLWSNVISLAQIVLSGLVAFGFYQPLAVMLDEATGGSYTYFMDYLSIWALFSAAMLVLKILDGLLSKTRMRFIEKVDVFGGSLVGFIAGGVMTGIVLASLHAAPLDPEALGGAMKLSKQDIANKSSLQSLDLAWLRLVESMSSVAALGSGAETFSAEEYVRVFVARREKYAESTSLVVRRSGR